MAKHTASTLQEYLDARLSEKDYGVKADVHFAPVSERSQRREVLDELKDQYVARVKQSARHTKSKRLHIGAAGFFNFDMVATAHEDACVLIDKNSNQRIFWDGVIKMLKDSPTKEDFRDNFTQRAAAYLPKELTNKVGIWVGDLDYAHFLGDTNWARKDDTYRHIQNLAAHDMIAAATVDVFDVPRCKEVANTLKHYKDGKGMHYPTSTVYGSNIMDFVTGHVDDTVLHSFSDEVGMALRAAHAKQPKGAVIDDGALREQGIVAAKRFFQKTRFLDAQVTDERVEVMVDGLIDALKQSGVFQPARDRQEVEARIDEAHAYFAEKLMTRFTTSDFQDLCLGSKPSGNDFHGTAVELRLAGFHALAGRKDSTIYLCDTHSNRPMMKLQGGAVQERSKDTQGLVGGIQ